MIDDGDCIYIDSGSTTYHIAKFIKGKNNLTVVTNSIPVISELMNTDVELIIIGGKIPQRGTFRSRVRLYFQFS